MGKTKLKPSWVWPRRIAVDRNSDGELVYINTGPYNKSVIGETRDDINKYLVHLQERYLEQKRFFIEKMLELNKEEDGNN